MSDVNTMTEAEELIDRLTAAEAVWAATPVSERVSMLRRMHADVAANAAQWVQVARTIKVLPAESPLVGEEWFGGPYVVLEYVRLLIQTLSRLQQGTDVLAGYEAGSAPGERLALHVAPHGAFDRLLYSGYTTQVWMTPGVTMDQVRSQAGLAQRTPTRTHGVSLVLGAGNVFSIPVLDVLYQLFAANRVVVLKLNPITDPMLEIFERIFAAFVEPGVVRIVTGGAETGDLLASSADVTAVHMTGSEATHDAIVWGFGEDGATAKAAGTPDWTSR